MASATGEGALDKKTVVRLLRESLVPVDPNPAFVKRLRARMVMFKGNGFATGWMLFVMAGIIFALVAATLGVALRVVLALVGLLGLLERQNRGKHAGTQAA